MSINIRQFAKKLGVSIATISRATNLNTQSKVAPATLKRINTLIKKYNYVPNIAARELNNPGKRTIGIILPYHRDIFYNSYYNHILSGISNYLHNRDYKFKLILLNTYRGNWDWYDFKAGEGVSGIILTHWFIFFSKYIMKRNRNIPCVIINDFDKGINSYFVYEDSLQGGTIAAKYLYDLGHRKTAIITGSKYSSDSCRRVEGFISFYKSLGLLVPDNLIVEGDFSDFAKTYKAVDKIIKKSKGVTSIFCCNDNIAFATINRLKERHIFCPEDISIIGYDDDWRSKNFTPSLTTIQVPLYSLGQKASEILINHIETQSPQKKLLGNTCLPVQLIRRQSVKDLRVS